MTEALSVKSLPTNQGGDRPKGSLLVSIVIPAFNGEGAIETTLGSVFGQTYPNTEWLVIDDGSHDGTSDVVQRLISSHPGRGRLIRHEKNWGLSRTLNQGFQESRGEAVLVLHQDIQLLSNDWISRALQDLLSSGAIALVTGDYGIPDIRDVNFAQRVFGIMRRQFHAGSTRGKEYVTFTEFKCDLARPEAIRDVGGFPERFRIAGEDLWVSYSLRAKDRLLLKDYELKCVQRFWGDATSVRGNIRKEFTFGQAVVGTLLRFRSAPFRNLKTTPYSRSRAWNRASQPFFLLAGLMMVLGAAFTRNWWFLYALAALLGGRLVYYGWRLWPDLKRMVARPRRALAEAAAGSWLGVLSDFSYTLGALAGLVRWIAGASV
jgi:glycosyltransferase involved in cell wall biosynthesis